MIGRESARRQRGIATHRQQLGIRAGQEIAQGDRRRFVRAPGYADAQRGEH